MKVSKRSVPLDIMKGGKTLVNEWLTAQDFIDMIVAITEDTK